MEIDNSSPFKNNRKSCEPCVYVLALGGTIASFNKNPSDEFYQRPSVDINTLISNLNLETQKLTVVGEQLFQKISHEMTHDDLLLVARKINELANDPFVDGIVITQGTNSIEESAYFISLVIKTTKPIVFTGAFRPNNALGYDGDRNLYNAILIAGSKKSVGIGVVLTFNDSIVTARDAFKFNPCIVGDFSANGVGVIGCIQGKCIHIQNVVQYNHTSSSEFNISDINNFAKIYIIYGHLGADSIFINAAIASEAKGIISCGMGKGYQPKEVTDSLIDASRRGIIIVRASRTGQGIVNKDTKLDDDNGFIVAGSLSPQKARILLAIALTKTEDRIEIQRIFDQY